MKRMISGMAAATRQLQHRHWVFGGCATLACLAALASTRPSPRAPGQSPGTMKSAAPLPSHDAAARQAIWEKAQPRLQQAEQESAAALEEAVAQVNQFFAQRRLAARPFAEWLIGMEGKWRYLAGRWNQAEFLARQIFKTGSLPSTASLPDQFGSELRQKFTAIVLDPAQLREAMTSASSLYANRLRDIEARLVVDLRADLGDNELSFPDAPLPMEMNLAPALDAAMREASRLAEGDVILAVIMEFLQNPIGDEITDLFGADKWPTFFNVGSDIAVGEGVGRVMNHGLTKMGYDPEGKVAKRVEQVVDRIWSFVTVGGPDASGVYHTGLRGEWSTRCQAHAARRTEALRRAILEESAP